MGKRILYELVCEREILNVDLVEKLLECACGCFVPLRMNSGYCTKKKYRNYNFNKLIDNLNLELKEKVLSIELKSSTNSFSISQNSLHLDFAFVTYILDSDIITNKFERIFEEFVIGSAVVAYSSSFEDSVQQSAKSVTYYEMKDLSLDGVKLKDSKTVDIEYNPGHMHYVNGLMFGSCYRMWFGKGFYQYISKDKLQSFSNCYENVELENEVTRITLYENLWDYAKEENRAIQWDFRRSVGMDEVAHALEEEFSNRKVTDSEMEILTGSFEHGGIRLIHQYFDEKGNVVHKSKAKIVKSAEYSADGKILFSEERKL